MVHARPADLPPHTPGAGRRLLAEHLGRELPPDVTDERRAELLAAGQEAMDATARRYGKAPAAL
jgi:hypothetical protein